MPIQSVLTLRWKSDLLDGAGNLSHKVFVITYWMCKGTWNRRHSMGIIHLNITAFLFGLFDRRLNYMFGNIYLLYCTQCTPTYISFISCLLNIVSLLPIGQRIYLHSFYYKHQGDKSTHVPNQSETKRRKIKTEKREQKSTKKSTK